MYSPLRQREKKPFQNPEAKIVTLADRETPSSMIRDFEGSYKQDFMSDSQLYFSKYEAQDFDNYYSIVRQDEVMRYISGKGLTMVQAWAKFISILEQGAAEEPLGYFKVYNEDDVFIGDCKLVQYKHDTSLLELGYILKPEYWGKGYGAMIGQKLLALADEVAPSKNIIGLIDPGNKASKKLLEKLGFTTCFSGIEDGLPTEKLLLKKSGL